MQCPYMVDFLFFKIWITFLHSQKLAVDPMMTLWGSLRFPGAS